MKTDKAYKRNKHPLAIRLLAIWRIITCRNFILVCYHKSIKDEKPTTIISPLYRSDYDTESDLLALKGAAIITKANL